MKKFILLLLALFVSGLVSGCGGDNIVFMPVKEAQPLKFGKIAVVCGHDDPYEFMIAQIITTNLNADERFKVIPQEEIQKIFPSYPTTLLKEHVSSDGSRTWTVKENLPVLKNIREKLDVDYIFFVWANGWLHVTGSYGNYVETYIASWLVRYPDEKMSGYSSFSRREDIGFFEGFDKNGVKNAQKRLTEKIAFEMADKIKKEWK